MRFLIVLSILVLASCTKKEAEPAAAEAADTQAPAEAEAPPEAPAEAEPAAAPDEDQADWKSWGEEGVATLIAPGKAPLRALRRTFEKGSRAEVELEVTAVGTEAEQVGARYLVALETKKVSGDGAKANVGFKVKSAVPIGQDTDPDAAANFARLEGLSGSYSVDALGRISEFELEAPKDAARQTAGAVDNLKRLQALLSIPLPEAAVGVGGQWSVFSVLDETRPVAQRTTYLVTKAEGSKVELRMKLEQMNKTVDLEGSVKLLGFSGAGAGAAKVDLSSLVPKSVAVENKRALIFFKVDTSEKIVIDLNISTKLAAQ